MRYIWEPRPERPGKPQIADIMLVTEQSSPSLGSGTRVHIDPATNEPVILFPEGVLHLSETAQAIISLCDGRRTVREMVDILGSQYDADQETLQQDVLDVLEELVQRKLVIV